MGEGGQSPPRSGFIAAWPLLVFAVCLAVYLPLHLSGVQGRAMDSNTTGDEPHYLIIARSIIEDRDLSLEDDYQSGSFRTEGYFEFDELPPHLAGGRDGRLVPWHSVFLPLLLVPGYAAVGWKGAGVTMVVLMCFTALFTFLLLRRFTGDRSAALVTLFFFLTYPLITYSHMIYPEVPAALLTVAGLYLLVSYRDSRKPWQAVAAGLAAGFMPLLHPKFIVLTAALAVLAFICSGKRLKGLASFFVPVAACLAFLLFWTWYLYGPDIVHGLTVTAGEGTLLENLSPWGVFGLYLDRVWGLLPYAPLYLLLFAGMPLPRKVASLKSWKVFLPLAVVLVTLTAGLFRDWKGGTAPAPRYLVPVMALFVVCAGLAWSAASRKWLRAVILVIAGLQVALTVMALVYPYGTYCIHVENNQLYHHFLGDNPLSATLERVFPLLHSPGTADILVLAAWVIFISGLVYARRFYLDNSPWDGLGPEH